VAGRINKDEEKVMGIPKIIGRVRVNYRLGSFMGGRLPVWALSVCLCLSLALSAGADTIVMKTGEELKGLVVEEHHDRVIFSTADGEVVLQRKDFQSIEYDDPAYSLLSVGLELERQEKFVEALSYYEKAGELNPDLKQARQAAIGIRSRLWAGYTEGPLSEIQKMQDIENAWQSATDMEDQLRKAQKNDERLLWERLGMSLGRKGDWVTAQKVSFGKPAHKAGLRRGDRFVRIDGQSIRYLNESAVLQKFLEPRFSTLILVLRRRVKFPSAVTGRSPKQLGLKFRQDYEGIVIDGVKEDSPADKIGLKEKDMLVGINGELTRYMPLREAEKLIRDADDDLILTIDRNVQMPRK